MSSTDSDQKSNERSSFPMRDVNLKDLAPHHSVHDARKSDENTHTPQEQRPNVRTRRQHDIGQLSPHLHRRHSGGGNGAGAGSSSSSPSSPVTPGSMRSAMSRHSSIRRKASLSPAAQAALAEELADKQSLKVICRTMSSYRVVHLLYQNDVDLFDAIQEWKDKHPTLWVDDAIDAFAAMKGSDALAQLVYSTEAFDIILKYDAPHEDLSPIFDNHTVNDHTLKASPQPPSPRNLNEPSRDLTPLPIEKQAGNPSSSSQRTLQSTDADTLPSVPAKSVSRAFSLKSTTGSIRLSAHSKVTELTAEQQGPRSMPHISLPMSTQAGEEATGQQPLQLLRPLDCSTDLFPSPKSSTVGIESEDLVRTYAFPSASEAGAKEGDRASRKAHRVPRPSKAKRREWKTQLHRRDFQLALLREGLFLELEKSIDSDAVYIKVLAPFWRLEVEAQKTSCKADLASTILPSIPYASRIFPRVSRLLPCLRQPGLEQRREAVLFKVARLADFHLAEPGRRWSDVVRHAGAVRKDGMHAGSHSGTDGRPGFFQTSRRGYLVNSIMMRTESRNHYYGRKMGLRTALRRGVYQKLYALHDGSFQMRSQSTHDLNYRAQLQIKWARRFWKPQPLDLVNAYFGERIGIYFAWLGHYTKWLTIPAAVGMAVFVFGIVNAARLKKLDATPNALFAIFDNALTMPFALFMSIWSTVYIEFWKRANQYYAFRWNMNDYERVELPRTEFRATKVRFSPVTGKRELYYPMYGKALRMLASSVAVLIAVMVVVGSVACLMIFKAWCAHHLGGAYATVVATAMLNLIIIIILGEIWCRLAEWLTDKENHKYTDAYEDSLIIKRYLFDFTNMYATLFYYAFFKAPFGGKIFEDRPDLQDACLYDACITELTVQLAVVFIGKQFLNGLFEMVFPRIMRTWNRKKVLADKALKRRMFMENRKRSKVPQWVKDDDLPSYEGRILKCYRKTVIQFGFCTLFVTSFPIAPAFALINNWIDIRMEASRLLTQYRRPIALRAKDIGMWERIMEFVSFTSVITNAAIIAFSSLWIKQNLFIKILNVEDEGELLAARLGFILVFEHVVFLFKFILRVAIPNVPLTIKLAVQRSKYMARVVSEGVDSEVDEIVDLDTDSDSDSDDEELEKKDEDSGDSLSEKGSNPMAGAGSGRNRGRQTSIRGEAEAKKPTRPRLGLQRVWSEAIMKNKKKKASSRRASRHDQSMAARGKAPGSLSLPTIHEGFSRSSNLPIEQRHSYQDSYLGPPLPGTGLGVTLGQLPQRHSLHRPRPPTLHPDHQRPLQHHHPYQIHHSIRHSPSRRPVPQRASTNMDGDWIVLEESRM